MPDLINFESDYEYILGNLQGNILEIQALFSSGDWTQEELEHIKYELESAAHTFAASQGLGGTRLDGATKAEITSNKNVKFYNDAQDEHGRYYAGHVEYGHHNRDGSFVPARPFMRPAVYAVADASIGRLGGTVNRYLQAAWTGQPMHFGHMNIGDSYQRAFYKSYKGEYMSPMNPRSNNLQYQAAGSASKSTSNYTVNRRTGEGSGWFSKTEGWRV